MKTLAPHIPVSAPRTSCAIKNDGLGWEDGFSVSIDGVTVGVRSNDAAYLPELRSLLPSWSEPSEAHRVDVLLSFLKGKPSTQKGVRHFHLVYSHWFRVMRSMELQEAKHAFQASLIEEVASHSSQNLYVLGEAVNRGGEALLIMGPPDARAPIIEKLCELGATAVRPLDGGALVVHSDFSLSGASRDNAIPLSRILVANRSSTRAAKPRLLSPGQGVMFMLPSCPLRDQNSAKALSFLAGLGMKVGIHEGSFEKLDKSLSSLKLLN